MYNEKKIIQIIEPREPYVTIYRGKKDGEYLCVKCPFIALVNFFNNEDEAIRDNDPYQDLVGVDYNIDGWFIGPEDSRYIETVPESGLKDFIVGYVVHVVKECLCPDDRDALVEETEKELENGTIKIIRHP